MESEENAHFHGESSVSDRATTDRNRHRRRGLLAALVGAAPVFFAVLTALGWGTPLALEGFAACVARGAPLERPAVLLRTVRVADARDWRATERSDVRIRDGRVALVGPAGSLVAEPGERVLDGGGRTLTAGLVDVRSELVFRDPLRRALPPRSVRESLRAQLRSGVTAVRDLGSPLAAATRLRDGLGVRLVGPAATLGGPWLTMETAADLAVDPYHAAVEDWPVDSSRDVVHAIDEVASRGGRWIAVRPPASLDRPGALERLDEIARGAAARGLGLAVHVASEDTLRWALSVRARSLEGLASYPGELPLALVDEIARSEAVVVPLAHLTRVREVGSTGDYELDRQTRWIGRASWWGELARLDRGIRARHGAVSERERARARLDTFRANLSRLVAAGVPIALGTGSPSAFAFPERPGDEIGELANAGLVGAALAQACITAGAELVSERKGTGVVAAGEPADLVVWACDPVEDARCYERPAWVVAAGRLVEGRPTAPARPFL